MKSYNVILFDLDGTLTDPELGITTCVQYALRHFGVEVSDRRELYSFIGPPLDDEFMRRYGFSPEKARAAADKYRERFRVKGIYENKVYPGIPELLRLLKSRGRTIMLATNKPEIFARQILEHFQLAEYFDVIAGTVIGGDRKNKAQVIRYALEQGGVSDKSRAVMIGDRSHDMEGAEQAGVDAIGVLYGYGSREEFSTAVAVAETVEELGEMLE